MRLTSKNALYSPQRQEDQDALRKPSDPSCRRLHTPDRTPDPLPADGLHSVRMRQRRCRAIDRTRRRTRPRLMPGVLARRSAGRVGQGQRTWSARSACPVGRRWGCSAESMGTAQGSSATRPSASRRASTAASPDAARASAGAEAGQLVADLVLDAGYQLMAAAICWAIGVSASFCVRQTRRTASLARVSAT